MLYQDIKSPGNKRIKNQAHLCWKQSTKRVALLNIPRHFNVIMVQSLQMK